jgi:ribose/xylose/arabinose/galactoside ABC-type transport system permease subunit
VGLLVRRSALGLMLEAIGMDAKAARLAGVNRRALLLTVYIVSGVLAGIAGVFATASVMTVDVSRTGYQLELDAILAVVIGGTSLAGGKFNVTGAVVGAILIATLDKTVVFLGISSSATPAFKAIVIVALCLLQSERVRRMFRQRRAGAPRSAKREVVAA